MQQGAPPVDVGAVVDVEYLQDLIEHELGPPKFEVVKEPSEGGVHGTGALVHEQSLRDLLDKEFGPPKFAVKKDEEDGNTAAAGWSGSGGIEQPGAAPCRTALTLEVTAGPAQGHVLEAGDDVTQIVIGRLPASSLAIADQEVSGRHLVLEYSERGSAGASASGGAGAGACVWSVSDTGSLNGSAINGTPISTPDRTPGASIVLSDGDVLELGGVTRVRVVLRPAVAAVAMGRRASGAAHASAAASHAHVGRTARPAAGARLLPNLPPLTLDTELPGLRLRVVLHSRLGTDHQRANTACEDVAHAVSPAPGFANGTGLLCVFDGHHGGAAAARAKELMPGVMAEKITAESDGGSLVTGRPHDRQQALLVESFLECDQRMASDEGCTATVVLLQRGPGQELLVQTANVGDSSAVFVNLSTGVWSKTTADHRIANNGDERARLQQRGHTVKRRLYGLNISRMLGDKFLKDEDLGFIAEPHVSEPESLPAGDRGCIIVASDGLWDVISEERAALLAIETYKSDPSTASAHLVADLLLSQALNLRSPDDITVLVAETLQ